MLLSGLLLAALAAIVALHVALLWDRVVHGRLTDPAVGLRWLGAAVLIGALVALRRLGIPLLWGRRALVFWLLVLLLHMGTVAPDEPGLLTDPVQILFVVPASVAPLGVLLVLLAAQRVRLGLGAQAVAPAGMPWGGPPLAGGHLLALPPRAPPA